jgi:hypothetical protein
MPVFLLPVANYFVPDGLFQEGCGFSENAMKLITSVLYCLY